LAGGPQFSWESHRLGPIPAIFFPTLFFVLKDTARFPVSSLVLLCSPFCGSISLSQVCDCFSGSPLPTEDWVFLIPALRLELVTLTGSLLLAQSSGFHVQCGPLRPPLGPTYAPAARVSLAPLGGIRGVLAAPGFISLGTSPSLSYEALFQSFAHAALRGLSLARWPLPQRLLRVVMALRTPALPPTHDGRGRSPGGDPHWPTPLRVAPHHYRGFCAGPYIQFYPVRPRLSAVPGCFVLAPARFRLGETAILKSAGFRRGVNSCPALPKFLPLGALRSRRTMGCFVPVLPYRTSARQCWALSLSIEGVHDSPIPPVAGGLSLSESSSTRTALRGSGDFSSGRRNPFSPHGAASRVSSSPCPWRRWSRGLLDGGRGAVAVSLGLHPSAQLSSGLILGRC